MITRLINGKVKLVPWIKTWYVNLFGFVFSKMKVLICPLSRKWDFAYVLTSLRNKKVSISLDLKLDMWTYFVLYLVKWKYWNVPYRENVILAYLVDFINGKVECVPWFKTWYVNTFGFVLVKMKVYLFAKMRF